MLVPQLSLRLLTTAIIAAGLILGFNTSIEAQGKKNKRSRYSKSLTSRSKRKSGKKPRRNARRNVRKNNDLSYIVPPVAPTTPDRIEVIEYGTSNSRDLGNLLSLPSPKNPAPPGSDPSDLSAPVKQVNVKIDPARVKEIQKALTDRGFYKDELSGTYNESTKDAMRRFQVNEKIPVTGYPTAHALKRLGLTKW
jgi:Putative peptidoglycan binding domain